MDTTDTLPLEILPISWNDSTYHLIQDTWLPAGTKQRGINYFRKLKDQGYTEVVTYGTVYGYGQVATAWCCREVGLLCTLFLPKTYPRTRMTREAIAYGAAVMDIGPDNNYPSTTVLAMKARAYAAKDSNLNTGRTPSIGVGIASNSNYNHHALHDNGQQNCKRKLLELGLDDPEFIQALADGIIAVKGNINPKRIWVAGGSGVLTRALSKAFPETELCVVQVGRKIYPDVLQGIRYTMYISPESFSHNAEIVPPYKSLRNYDAKVWRFVRVYGKDGDYIWNVK